MPVRGQLSSSRKGLAIAAALVVAFLAALAASAAMPTDASAGVPAICDEYPDLPKCDTDPVPPPPIATFCDENPDHPRCEDDAVTPFDGGDGPSGDASAGELPFTGYPLSPLLLLLLALLAAGLMIRAYLAARDRFRAGSSPQA